MSADPKLLAAIEDAKNDAVAARADFAATLSELQCRLNPRELAHNALDAARDRGEDLAERGVEFARERPAAAAGIAAAAVALVARKPILRGLRGLFGRSARPAPPEPLPPAPSGNLAEQEILP